MSGVVGHGREHARRVTRQPEQPAARTSILVAWTARAGLACLVAILASCASGDVLDSADAASTASQEGSGFGPGRLPITPIPDRFRCGEELFKVAFEEGVAYVSLPDGSMVELPRYRPAGGSDPEAPRIFTDGRLTFSQEIEGGRAVGLARGRMVAIPCERLPI